MSKDQKILITASTNSAVDNILKKFKDSSPETILRIGSFNEISSNCQKFTLENRRKQSEDWDEIKQLEQLIGKQKQSIRTLFRNKKIVKNQIIALKGEIENFNRIID